MRSPPDKHRLMKRVISRVTINRINTINVRKLTSQTDVKRESRSMSTNWTNWTLKKSKHMEMCRTFDVNLFYSCNSNQPPTIYKRKVIIVFNRAIWKLKVQFRAKFNLFMLSRFIDSTSCRNTRRPVDHRKRPHTKSGGFNEIAIVFLLSWKTLSLLQSPLGRFYSSRILFVIQILLQSITSAVNPSSQYANAFLCFTATPPTPPPRYLIALFSNFSSSSHDGFRKFYYFFLLLLTTYESWTVWRGFSSLAVLNFFIQFSLLRDILV